MTGTSVLFDAPGPRARRNSTIASVVGGVAILAGATWLYLTLNAPRGELPGYFDPSRWEPLAEPIVWQRLITVGMWNTLRAAFTASVLAVALGIAFSLLRSARSRWVRIPTAVVLEFVRGMPVLLMMLFILLVLNTGSFWAVVAALTLYNGALIGEALRAGLAALPRGQREAGLSLGMRPMQSKMLIEFPQAFRQMLPIIIAQLVVLLKDTSLGYIVGYLELLRVGMNQLASFYGNYYLFSFFVVVLVLYLAMNLSLSWLARWVARRTESRTGRPAPNPDEENEELLKGVATANAESRQTPGS
ncbi:amino acid ABC transporter permease [Agromyces sp. SYSU T0242]|uniref:amino acid ABC transporter permease n=1 Tax=Agromyces litoreus TaxID=3158561 RepID=UPI0033923389